MNTVDVGNFGIVVLTFVKIIFQLKPFSKKSTKLGEASVLGDSNLGTSLVIENLRWLRINLYPYILFKAGEKSDEIIFMLPSPGSEEDVKFEKVFFCYSACIPAVSSIPSPHIPKPANGEFKSFGFNIFFLWLSNLISRNYFFVTQSRYFKNLTMMNRDSISDELFLRIKCVDEDKMVPWSINDTSFRSLYQIFEYHLITTIQGNCSFPAWPLYTLTYIYIQKHYFLE